MEAFRAEIDKRRGLMAPGQDPVRGDLGETLPAWRGRQTRIRSCSHPSQRSSPQRESFSSPPSMTSNPRLEANLCYSAAWLQPGRPGADPRPSAKTTVHGNAAVIIMSGVATGAFDADALLVCGNPLKPSAPSAATPPDERRRLQRTAPKPQDAARCNSSPAPTALPRAPPRRPPS